MQQDERKILIAQLRARPGCEADVQATLADYGKSVRAEPGNEVFECYRDDDNPQHFIVYEIYSNEAAFKSHLSAAENAEVNNKLASLTEGGSSLTFLKSFI